jgi:hypothetical protein
MFLFFSDINPLLYDVIMFRLHPDANHWMLSAVFIKLREIVVMDSQNFDLVVPELKEFIELQRQKFCENFKIKILDFLGGQGLENFKVLDTQVSLFQKVFLIISENITWISYLSQVPAKINFY